MTSFEKLFRPRSIAAIGGLQASRVVEQCQLMGYEGDIWPVHPNKKVIGGLPVYASISALPQAPDVAFVGVNRHRTIALVKALRDKGCGAAICYASGFLEADEVGGEMQSALIAAAGDMPVLGPNCYGLINYADGVLLWPDQQGSRRLEAGQTGVAIITQSSNIAINFTMQRRGLPLAFVLTVGNQALVGISQLALAILDDPRVTTLGIYIEGFDSIQSMEELAHKSRVLQKPVVFYTLGKSAQSRAAAMTHTASLVSPKSATNAFLKRNGFGQADSIPVFLETLKLLHLHGPLDGYRVSSMSCSGGEAGIIADAAVDRKLYFPDLSPAEKAPLETVLGPLVRVANPLDYQTYCWAQQETMEAVYSAMVCQNFNLNYLILDFPHRSRCQDREWVLAVEAFAAALNRNRARGALVVSMAENISEDYTEQFARRGIVCLYGVEEALKATDIAADIGTLWQSPLPPPTLKLVAMKPRPFRLEEAIAKRRLAEQGLPVPEGICVHRIDQALSWAESKGYPLVLKACGMAHKTEHNGVRLNLQNRTQLRQAAEALLSLSSQLYCEAMVPDVVAELLVGIQRDAQFGLVLTIGSGGILVEILRDSQTLLVPADSGQVTAAIAALQSADLLNGYRGRPKADIVAAVDVILGLQDYAIARSEQLLELEVNPLLLCAEGKGVYIADALIILQEDQNDRRSG